MALRGHRVDISVSVVVSPLSPRALYLENQRFLKFALAFDFRFAVRPDYCLVFDCKFWIDDSRPKYWNRPNRWDLGYESNVGRTIFHASMVGTRLEICADNPGLGDGRRFDNLTRSGCDEPKRIFFGIA